MLELSITLFKRYKILLKSLYVNFCFPENKGKKYPKIWKNLDKILKHGLAVKTIFLAFVYKESNKEYNSISFINNFQSHILFEREQV